MTAVCFDELWEVVTQGGVQLVDWCMDVVCLDELWDVVTQGGLQLVDWCMTVVCMFRWTMRGGYTRRCTTPRWTGTSFCCSSIYYELAADWEVELR